MVNDLFFLYDEPEDTKTRFVSFMGEATRFDLAITTTNRFYGKKSSSTSKTAALPLSGTTISKKKATSNLPSI